MAGKISYHARFIATIGAGAASLIHIKNADGALKMTLSTHPGKDQISPQTPLAVAVLLANTPQLLCSYVFLGFNYLLTCMFAGYEWVSFSQKRQLLRVTEPSGKQRSTLYFQLPLAVGVPLLVISSLLSWLASQILFVVRVHVIGTSMAPQPADGYWFASCGYSPGAIVITVIVGSVMASVVLLVGLRKYPNTMPLAGTNSAAIAAACYSLPGDQQSVTEPLQWGVVSETDGIGHCSFSAGNVKPLVPGRIYR